MTDRKPVPWRPSPDEIGALLAPLAAYRYVILAVSGGADSIALMHLASLWARSGMHEPVLSVVTVDHQLRPGSRAEAEAVGEAAAAVGLPHTILTWDGHKPGSGVQNAAREARYALLAAHARLQSRDARVAIVTAHTADDQAETLWMRLARGSGVDGLAGMRAVRPLSADGPDLVRPLLGVTKDALVSWLISEGHAWCEDPSNADPRFERVRVRRALEAASEALPAAAMMALSARRLARAHAALDAATDDLIRSSVAWNGGAFAAIDAAAFSAAPEDLRVRLMARVLTAFSGDTPVAELAQVERIVADLQRTPALRTTAGGAMVRACSREIRIFREAGRMARDAIVLEPGLSLIWDRRFEVSLSPSYAAQAGAPIAVAALSPQVFSRLRPHLGPHNRLPARAAATLPAFWRGPELVALPGLADALKASDLSPMGDPVIATARFLSAPALSEDARHHMSL